MKVSEITPDYDGCSIACEGDGFTYTGILEYVKTGATSNPDLFWLNLVDTTLVQDGKEFNILDVVTLKLSGDVEIEITGYSMVPRKWAAVIQIDENVLSRTNVSGFYPWIDGWGNEYTVGGVTKMIKDSEYYEVLFGGVEN